MDSIIPVISPGLLSSIFKPEQWIGGFPADRVMAIKSLTLNKDVRVSEVAPEGAFVVNLYRKTFELWVQQMQTPTAVNLFNLFPFILGNPNYLGFLPSNYQLLGAPRLENTFSLNRWASGRFTLQAGTVSANNATLSGTFTIAAVNDTRDLNTWSAGDILQAASTDKDNVGSVMAADGVTAIVACDVPHAPSAARYSSAVATRGDGARITYSRALGQTNVAFPFIVVTGAPTANVAPIYLPPVEQRAPCSVSATLTLANMTVGDIIAIVVEIYVAQIDPLTGNYAANSGQVKSSIWRFTAAAAGETYSVSADRDGWLEDSVIVGVRYNCTTSGANPLYITNILGDFISWNQYTDKVIGGYRIMRYSSLAANTIMTFSAMVATEGVASGPVAPYVKASIGAGVGNPTTIPLLNYLFNNPACPISRVYRGQPLVKDILMAVFQFLDQAAHRPQQRADPAVNYGAGVEWYPLSRNNMLVQAGGVHKRNRDVDVDVID